MFSEASVIMAALYAPIGGLLADLLNQPVMYGMVAGAAIGLWKPSLLPLSSMYLYPLAGASFGYLYLGDMVGGDMVGAALGAAVGYGIYWWMMRSSPSSGLSAKDWKTAGAELEAALRKYGGK